MLLGSAGARSRAALVAFSIAPWIVAGWVGCFYEVSDRRPTGGGAGAGADGATTSAASGTGETSGASSSSTGSGIMELPCTVPDAACDAGCPPGIDCINGCCEITSPPLDCASAIDVTAGGWFRGTACNGPPPGVSDPQCVGTHPYLLLHVDQSAGDAGTFAISVDDGDIGSLQIAVPCLMGGGACLPLPTIVDAGTTFAFQPDVPDACAYHFFFEVKPQ